MSDVEEVPQVKTMTTKWYHVSRRLLPVKGFYFFVLAAIGDLLPFIPLFMKESLKLSSLETGIIYGIMPFVGFFVRPFIGAIADRTQKHKAVLALSCVLTGVFYLLILLVPSKNSPENSATFSHIETKIHCNDFDSYIYDCYKNDSSSVSQCPLSFQRYINLLENQTLSSGHVVDFVGVGNVSQTFNQNNTGSYDIIYNEIMRNKSCLVECQYKTTGEMSEYKSEACFTNHAEQTEKKCYDVVVTLTKEPDLIFTLPNISDITAREVKEDEQVMGNIVCRNFDLKGMIYEKKTYWQMLCNEETEMVCQLKCSLVNGDNICQSDNEPAQTDTFWLFLVIFLFANIAFAPIMSLGDAMAYDILGEKRHIWGIQRLFGTIGFALFALTSTFVMDMLSSENQPINFSVSFYIFAIFTLIASIVSCMMPISEDFACSQMMKNLSKLFRNAEIVAFLVVILIFGIFTGAIETFLFWYLKNLGNWSQIIAGLSLLMSCSAEVPMLFVSGRIIKRFGHVPCLYLAFAAYSVRFISYSFLTNPWFVLPIELLHGLTFGLMYAAATSYGSIITPPGMSGTIQGLIGGIHFGFGKGIGSKITGVLFGDYALGSRWTFRLYGILSLVFLVIYVLINMFCFKKKNIEKSSKKVKCKDKDSGPEDKLLTSPSKEQSDGRNIEDMELEET